MNQTSIDNDNGHQIPQQSSVSPDCVDQAPLQSLSSQDIGSQNSPVAAVSRDQVGSTGPTQGSEAQATHIVTLASDETRLSKAVVIPQRRPSDRARGFVRAYAPDLRRCGINQEEFLRFIDGLNRSVASNPAVEAVDLAGGVVGAIPGSEFVGAPIIGTALQVAAGAYKEVNARRGVVFIITVLTQKALPGRCSQNSYLIKMNDELFRPRGLYCLIMSYDIKSRSNTIRPGQSNSPSHIIRDGISSGPKGDRLRNSDGILGASNFPGVAELIYPPQSLPENNSQEGWSEFSFRSAAWANGKSKIQDMMAARDDKEDLKSQVKFQKKNPTSLLNHLMDPKAELSEKDRQKQEKREAEQQKKEEEREREAEKRARKYPDKAPKVHKPKEGLLYLMIVNIPSIRDI